MTVHRLPFASPLALAAALGASMVVAGLWWRSGGELFSPGALSGRGDGRPRGGVASHAELTRRCGACHPSPFGASSLSDLCLACHDEVAAELTRGETLHGKLAAGRRCLPCHTEHRGAEAPLTAVTWRGFDHAITGFPLTGRHRDLACDRCHGGAQGGFARAPTRCVGCHRGADVHGGQLGDDCGRCHGTDTWKRAELRDHRFPMDHGAGGSRVPCATCHPAGYRGYDCYGCHEHTPENVARKHRKEGISDFRQCVRCHPTGTEEEAEGHGEEGDDD